MNKSMTNLVSTRGSLAKRWTVLAIRCWIGVVLIGQWMFAIYIFAQFTLPLASGTIDESQFRHMIKGYVNGETFNNTLLLIHVIPVMFVCFSAVLQLIPFIRNRFPVFHRINGRLFLIIGLIGALGGLYLTWVTGSRLSNLGALGVTINGLLIPIAVYLAWHFALNKKFSLHRRFAVHAFILINGVWSFRLYLMGWYLINQGPLGNSSTIDGPADIVLSLASFLLPMAIAELVFLSEKSAQPKSQWIAAVAATIGMLVTLIGVVAATMMMWGPRVLAVF